MESFVTVTVTVRNHVVTYKEDVPENVYQERDPQKHMTYMETVQKVMLMKATI